VFNATFNTISATLWFKCKYQVQRRYTINIKVICLDKVRSYFNLVGKKHAIHVHLTFLQLIL